MSRSETFLKKYKKDPKSVCLFTDLSQNARPQPRPSPEG